MAVTLVVLVPGRFVRKNAVKSNVIPETTCVMSPNPVRILILRLLSGVSTKRTKDCRYLAFSDVIEKSVRMSYGDRIFPQLAKWNQVVGRCDVRLRRVIYYLPMCQSLAH